jgi:DNA polymerase III epsilon subunit-like protein
MDMKLLFLDTETSGVDCNKDQIIEIGGVIFELENYELKMVDYFQTTVALRKVLDERITRITGITEGELATAPALVSPKYVQCLDRKIRKGHCGNRWPLNRF